MNQKRVTLSPYERWIISAGVLFLAAYLALPSLFDAWSNDRYSRGSMAAFIIWTMMVFCFRFLFRVKIDGYTLFWIMSAVLFCAIGSMTSLRVLYHAALVLALIDLSNFNLKSSVIAALSAVSWLPSLGWFISRLHTGGLGGWERPTIVGFACVLLVLANRQTTSSSS